MPIENPNAIDIVAQPAPDALNLLITDSGQTSEPSARMRLFKAKLLGYMRYIASPRFEQDYPEVNRAKVAIVLVSRFEATPEMKEIEGMQLPSGVIVSIKFDILVDDV